MSPRAALWTLWHWCERPEIVDVQSTRLGRLRATGVRVFLNGREISLRCWRVELYGGALMKAYCYKLNEHGKMYLEGRDTAREVRWGFGLIEYPPHGVQL